ncbi:MAG TPA: hypothetical protein VJX67_13180 [Blastocatellia bacterium]|nr:hypothetical protein [Blastocatellia bacterium]
MRIHFSRLSVVGLGAAAFAFLVVAAAPISAQHDDEARVRMQQDSEREAQLQVRNGGPGKPANPKQAAALLAQVAEDFKRILILHNQIAKATTSGKDPDYRFVSDAAAEIKKRAGRLQATLELNRGEASTDLSHPKRVDFGDTEVKQALIALCQQIESFVSNPVIQSPGTVDAKQSAKARVELESVIELSGSIRKSAAKLSKSSK